MSDPLYSNTISHKGIVQRSDDRSVFVIITAQTACSGCHAEGECAMSGMEEKVIEVTGSYTVKQGDDVTVHMNKSTGYKALLLAYLIPLLIIVTSLIILTMLKVPELTAGILSVAMLIPYFMALFLLRNSFKSRFSLTIND